MTLSVDGRPDDDDFENEVSTRSFEEKAKDLSDDPFNVSIEEARKLKGLSRNYIRKADRRLKKQEGYYGKDDAKSKQISDESFYGYGYLDCVIPPYNLGYLAKLYDISPAHHAAVDAKVEGTFGLGWDLIESSRTKRKRARVRTERGRDAFERALEAAKDDVFDWIDDLNNIDTLDEIMKAVGKDYETTGNAYIEIGRTRSGQIGYLGHVPAEHVRIRRQRDGFVQMIGRDIVYFRNFGEDNPNPLTEDQNPNELIHLKNYSPSSLYYGIPDIVSAKNALAGNEFASRFNLDYFENKAIPRHAVIVKGASLSRNSVKRIMEFFESGLRGKNHRSLFVPLSSKDADIEFKAIEAGKQDFSFGEYRVANNEEIFMAHRTPPTRAGVYSKGQGIAASKDADKVFKESVTRPTQAVFEKKFNKMFKEVTDMFTLKLNELALVDEDVQSQIDERYLRHGTILPDEIRREKGLGPLPEGMGQKPPALTAQQRAEQTAQATGNRVRDQERQSGSSDGVGDTGARNAQGEGRKTS